VDEDRKVIKNETLKAVYITILKQLLNTGDWYYLSSGDESTAITTALLFHLFQLFLYF
jgi:hypothetical protein